MAPGRHPPVGRLRRVVVPAVPVILAVPIALAVAVLIPPAPAAAYEDEITLGLGAGYAWSVAEDDRVGRHGIAGTLTVSGGLDDVLALRALLSYAAHPASPDTTHVVIGGGEIIYLLDVLELVPFFGAGIDAAASIVDGDGALELGAHLLVGVDWLVSFDWLVGLDIRVTALPLDVAGGPRLDLIHGQVVLRVSRRFLQ